MPKNIVRAIAILEPNMNTDNIFNNFLILRISHRDIPKPELVHIHCFIPRKNLRLKKLNYWAQMIWNFSCLGLDTSRNTITIGDSVAKRHRFFQLKNRCLFPTESPIVIVFLEVSSPKQEKFQIIWAQ